MRQLVLRPISSWPALAARNLFIVRSATGQLRRRCLRMGRRGCGVRGVRMAPMSCGTARRRLMQKQALDELVHHELYSDHRHDGRQPRGQRAVQTQHALLAHHRAETGPHPSLWDLPRLRCWIYYPPGVGSPLGDDARFDCVDGDHDAAGAGRCHRPEHEVLETRPGCGQGRARVK